MKTAFIGGGNMATALIRAMLEAGAGDPGSITVAEINPARAEALRRECGVEVVDSIPAAVRAGRVIVLATKPQDFATVLPAVAAALGKGQLVVSIAAGRTTADLEQALPGAPVVRVMPNLNGQVRMGMSAYCLGRLARPRDARAVRRLLEPSGRVIELPEEQFDAVTALSGSGPAFVAYVADAMIRAGGKLGLRPANSRCRQSPARPACCRSGNWSRRR